MINRQLKPAYNAQFAPRIKSISAIYNIHNLKPHLNSFEYLYENIPENLTADASYGSEGNYEYLESKDIETYYKVQYLR